MNSEQKLNFRAEYCEGCGAILNGNEPLKVSKHKQSCGKFNKLMRKKVKDAFKNAKHWFDKKGNS